MIVQPDLSRCEFPCSHAETSLASPTSMVHHNTNSDLTQRWARLHRGPNSANWARMPKPTLCSAFIKVSLVSNNCLREFHWQRHRIGRATQLNSAQDFALRRAG